MADLTIGPGQHADELAAHVGDRISVRLPENPGGGYRWMLESVDTEKLEMVEHQYEAPRTGVGGAGASIWTFTATKAGRARLELKKVRPWNADDPASERFVVDLRIGRA